MYSNYSEEKSLKALVQLRKQRGLTQKQVEESLKLRSLSIYDYESGRLKLPIELAVRLCQLYQCSLEDLLGIELLAKEGPITLKSISLASLGLVGGKQKMFLQTLLQDPVILAEMGEMEIEVQKSPFDALLGNLSENQKRKFSIELLKYINSLIGIDQKITAQEMALRDFLMKEINLEFTESEQLSIRKALSVEYFGKTVDKKFPRQALKHFLVWTLFVVAFSDGELDYREDKYIERVASYVGVKKKDYEYIKGNMERTWNENKENS